MYRQSALLLSLAVSACMLTGCEMDDSIPSRPRTANPLEPSMQGQQNAEHRSLEKPARELPTSGHEFPGQSKATATDSRQVATLDVQSSNSSSPSAPWFTGPSGWHALGHSVGPTTVYNRDTYQHVLPALPPNPGTVPQVGSTPAPGGDWSIDHSWGQGLVLENAPHRAWPDTSVSYVDGPVYHNPTYYFNVQEHQPWIRQNNGSTKGDIISTVIEVPWFFLNTAFLLVEIPLEPPLAQRVTERDSRDPNFRGHLPAEGIIVPAPFQGELKWGYPFQNADGTVKRSDAGAAPVRP